MKLQRVDILGIVTGTLLVAVAYIGWNMYWDKVEREERRAAWIERRAAEVKAAQEKIDEPAATWYALRGINLDDFVEGENPLVAFDSEVRKPFVLHWTVQVHMVDAKAGFPPVCETGATFFREPNDNNGLAIIPWTELWKRNPCKLNPGSFVLKAHALLQITDYPDKEVERASNIFKVLPAGSQLYIDPKQVQKLDSVQ